MLEWPVRSVLITLMICLMLTTSLAWCEETVPKGDASKYNGDGQQVRIVVVGDPQPVERLREIGFKAKHVAWQGLEPNENVDAEVIFLSTGWANDPHRYAYLESKSEQFHAFVKQGGGLLVCQPNPKSKCEPTLLPFPVTFRNGYDEFDTTRIGTGKEHFITLGLEETDLPFPYDPILKIDERYTVLAMQKSTQWPSLAACAFGDGRIVIQTGSENPKANLILPNVAIKRMVLWAAHREMK